MPTLDPRRVVYRRISAARLITGIAAVGIGIGIQVVIWGPGRLTVGVDDLAAGAAGLLSAAIGLSVVLRPVADFCAACNRRLEPTGLRLAPESIRSATAALRAGDVRSALRLAGDPTPDGKWVTIWFCPACRSTIVWKADGDRVVAAGGEPIVGALTGVRKR